MLLAAEAAAEPDLKATTQSRRTELRVSEGPATKLSAQTSSQISIDDIVNQQSSIHPNPPETQSVRSPEPPQGGLGDRLLSSNSCISSQRRGQTGRRPKQRKPSKAQERCARNESGTLLTRHTHRGTRAAGSERRRTRTRRRKRAERRRDPQSAAALARRAQASGRRRRYKKASCSPEVRLATYLGNLDNGSGASGGCTIRAKNSAVKISRTERYLLCGHHNIQGKKVVGRQGEVTYRMRQRGMKAA